MSSKHQLLPWKKSDGKIYTDQSNFLIKKINSCNSLDDRELSASLATTYNKPTKHPALISLRGSALMESVIAVAVLSIAVPMVFGTLAESGKSGLAAQAETRSAWIVSACMDEIHASRAGNPQYFSPTVTGQPFPPPPEGVWALAFSEGGESMGKISRDLYDSGSRELDGKRIAYIATISAEPASSQSDNSHMLRVDITLEYPAASNALKRAKIAFHTHTP